MKTTERLKHVSWVASSIVAVVPGCSGPQSPHATPETVVAPGPAPVGTVEQTSSPAQGQLSVQTQQQPVSVRQPTVSVPSGDAGVQRYPMIRTAPEWRPPTQKQMSFVNEFRSRVVRIR